MDIYSTASIVLELTKAQRISWEHEDGTPCFTTTYNDGKFIICKSTIEDGRKSLLFNQINDNYEIIGDINRWEDGDDNYSKINSLYELIERNSLAAA